MLMLGVNVYVCVRANAFREDNCISVGKVLDAMHVRFRTLKFIYVWGTCEDNVACALQLFRLEG